VATGSYNFTRSARVANAENLLILRDNPALAQAFARNWQRHRAEALRLDSLDDMPARRGKQDGRESDR
jgi:phosphatidylserine/phosphatidylglycerophosphate/cardiolipin synthase-like enzyme